MYWEDIDEYDPSCCPFCGSNNIEKYRDTGETEQKHCHACGQDFVLWFDEPYDVQPIEITDTSGAQLL